MNHNSNYSLFINTLLSNKEISVKSNTIQITESSVFKNTRMILPVECIDSQTIKRSRLDYQWLVFSFVCFLASGVFSILGLTQSYDLILALGVIFAVIGVTSIVLSYKFKNMIHTFQNKMTGKAIFSISEAELDYSQIKNLIDRIETKTTKKLLSNKEKHETEMNYQLNEYYKLLNILNEDEIVSDILLERLQQLAYNKVFGRFGVSSSNNETKKCNENKNEVKEFSNVIKLPISN